MRTISGSQSIVYGKQSRSDHVRVDIKDSAGAWQYYTWLDRSSGVENRTWVKSAEIKDGEDQPCRTFKVTLIRAYDKLNLSPEMQTSKLNQYTGSYAKLIDLKREIKIYVAVMPEGIDPETSDWIEKFHGKIDEIEFGGDGNEIIIHGRDMAGDLQEKFIEAQGVYGSSGGTAVETVMQSILTDQGTGVTLYTPISPAWNITEFIVDKEPVLEVLRRLANQIGWEIKYKWRSGTSQFELTLYEPDRACVGGVLRTFGPDEYNIVSSAKYNSASIRNKIQIVWTDTSTPEAPAQQTTISQDAASIAQYGIRFMEIIEDAASNIDSAAEATAMADAILADLKEPTLYLGISMPAFIHAEVGDYYSFEGNQDIHDQTLSLAVSSWSLNYKDGHGKIAMLLKGEPSAGRRRWLALDARPGGIQKAADEFGLHGRVEASIAPTTYTFAVGGIGAHNKSVASESSFLPNGDFLQQSIAIAGSGWPPDNWQMVTGTWGAADDVYIDTASTKTGNRVLHFRNTVTAAVGVKSKLFPVTADDLYVGSAIINGASVDGADLHQIYVTWYQADKTTVIGSTNIYLGRITGGTWQQLPAVHMIAPVTAKWGRIYIYKATSTAHNLYIDTIRFSRAFDGVSADGSPNIGTGVTTDVNFTATTYNYAAAFSLVTDEYTTPYPGIYYFDVNCRLPNPTAAGTANYFWVFLYKDTGGGYVSLDNTVCYGNNAGKFDSANISMMDKLDVGDKIKVAIYHNLGLNNQFDVNFHIQQVARI